MKPKHLVERQTSERARSEYRPRRERLGIQAKKRLYDDLFCDLPEDGQV